MGSLPASAGSSTSCNWAMSGNPSARATPRAQKDANIMRPSGELRTPFGRKSQRVVFRHQVASELLRSSVGQTSDRSTELAPVARPTGQNQDLDGLRPPCAGRVASARSGHHPRRRVHHRG